MRQSTVWPERGNRVEAEVSEVAMLMAEAEQLVGRDHFIDATLWCLFLDPFKKPRYGRPITRLGSLMSRHFDGVLDGFWQHRRVTTGENAGAAFFERLRD